MKKAPLVFSVVILGLFVIGGSALHAGAKLKINDNATIDLGFRLQTLLNVSDKDIDANDGVTDLEGDTQFVVRRARLRLGADIGDKVSMFLQTEFNEEGTRNAVGGEVRLIDAFITLKPKKHFNIVVGENMAPANRQNMTSSGALMAIDRPSMANKSLTWGLRGKHNFTLDTTPTSGASLPASSTRTGIFGKVGVRDLGVTLFGNPDVNDKVHAKWYFGVYDGINAQGFDSERTTGRVQFNFGDAEPGYYNLSTYLGGKNTISFGLSYDAQSDVAVTSVSHDYEFIEFDFFADVPVGGGSLTVETAYETLDLDGFRPSAEGDGFYVQAGFYKNKFQPWLKWETWNSDSTGDDGNYDILSVGLNYYIMGHNANVKFGYEQFDADFILDSNGEDSIGSFVVGLYTTF